MDYNKEYSEADMRFWPTEMVQEYDSYRFEKELNNIDKNYNFGELSWDLTLIDRFKIAVEIVYKKTFPFKSTLEWDMKMIEGEGNLIMMIRTENWGSLSVNLPVKRLKSKNCPAKLPDQLVKNFTAQFERKKKEYKKGNIND